MFRGNKKTAILEYNRFIVLVDNSFEISNISLIPRDFELTIQGVKFITEKIKLLSD